MACLNGPSTFNAEEWLGEDVSGRRAAYTLTMTAQMEVALNQRLPCEVAPRVVRLTRRMKGDSPVRHEPLRASVYTMKWRRSACARMCARLHHGPLIVSGYLMNWRRAVDPDFVARWCTRLHLEVAPLGLCVTVCAST